MKSKFINKLPKSAKFLYNDCFGNPWYYSKCKYYTVTDFGVISYSKVEFDKLRYEN